MAHPIWDAARRAAAYSSGMSSASSARLSKDERTLLDWHVEALASQLGEELRTVWLFGSRARGEESDRPLHHTCYEIPRGSEIRPATAPDQRRLLLDAKTFVAADPHPRFRCPDNVRCPVLPAARVHRASRPSLSPIPTDEGCACQRAASCARRSTTALSTRTRRARGASRGIPRMPTGSPRPQRGR